VERGGGPRRMPGAPSSGATSRVAALPWRPRLAARRPGSTLRLVISQSTGRWLGCLRGRGRSRLRRADAALSNRKSAGQARCCVFFGIKRSKMLACSVPWRSSTAQAMRQTATCSSRSSAVDLCAGARGYSGGLHAARAPPLDTVIRLRMRSASRRAAVGGSGPHHQQITMSFSKISATSRS
jgi:hypothetical protein